MQIKSNNTNYSDKMFAKRSHLLNNVNLHNNNNNNNGNAKCHHDNGKCSDSVSFEMRFFVNDN